MKKLLVFLLFFIFSFNVNGSTKVEEKILLEKVSLVVEERVSFKEVLEVSYELLPKDIENKNLDWRVINRNTDLIIKLNEVSTNLQKGVFLIDIENKSDKSLSFKVEVLQDKKVINSIDIIVETEKETESRLFLEDLEDLKKLIKRLDIDINKENVDENRYLLEEIDELVTYELKEKLSSEEVEKVESVYNSIDEYELKVKNNKKIIIIIVLSIAFFTILTLMFRKEKK